MFLWPHARTARRGGGLVQMGLLIWGSPSSPKGPRETGKLAGPFLGSFYRRQCSLEKVSKWPQQPGSRGTVKTLEEVGPWNQRTAAMVQAQGRGSWRFCAWHMSWVAQLEGCSEVVQASPSLWEGQHIHLKRHLPHGVRGSAFFRAGAACVSQGQSVGSQK